MQLLLLISFYHSLEETAYLTSSNFWLMTFTVSQTFRLGRLIFLFVSAQSTDMVMQDFPKPITLEANGLCLFFKMGKNPVLNL